MLVDVNARGAEAAAEVIRQTGGRALAQPTDVARPEDMDALLAHAVEAFWCVDVWHNNAFRSVFKTIDEQTLE